MCSRTGRYVVSHGHLFEFAFGVSYIFIISEDVAITKSDLGMLACLTWTLTDTS